MRAGVGLLCQGPHLAHLRVPSWVCCGPTQRSANSRGCENYIAHYERQPEHHPGEAVPSGDTQSPCAGPGWSLEAVQTPVCPSCPLLFSISVSHRKPGGSLPRLAACLQALPPARRPARGPVPVCVWGPRRSVIEAVMLLGWACPAGVWTRYCQRFSIKKLRPGPAQWRDG